MQNIRSVSIPGAPETTVTKEFRISTESTMLNDFHSIAQENCSQLFDSPETGPAQNISNLPVIERQSKQYRVDVLYLETLLGYSRISQRIQPSISSLRNTVEVHLKGTVLSGSKVSSLTVHAYYIQRPIFTSRHSLLTYAPTPRHISEGLIWLHSKHIFFLPECFQPVPGSTLRVSAFRHGTFRCRRCSSYSA